MLAKTELSPTAKRLLAMADYIEEHGWCQKRCYGPGGSVCIMGAGHQTASFDTGTVHKTLYNHLGGEPAEWNDKPTRTKEQVITMLRELAFNLGSRE